MSFSADPVYNEIMDTYFADTPTIGQEVWDRYVQYVNPSLQSNPTFEQFLDSYIGIQGGVESLSSVTSLPTGVYTTYLNAYMSDRTPADQLNIWQAFLATQGYTAAPSDTDINSTSLQNAFGNFVYNLSNTQNATIQSLEQFASQYNALGFGTQVLGLNQVTSIPQGFYSNYLSAFLGGSSSIEQLDTWRSFLVSIGYPQVTNGQTIYTPSQDELNSPTMQSAFVQWITAIRSKELVYSAQTSQSPQQVAVNTVLSGVVSSLSNMLNATEMLVQNQANALVVYGQIQQQYATMMSRVPTLAPGTVPNITVPALSDLQSGNWDLSSLTFGYDNISLSDVVNWGIQNALTTPGTAANWSIQSTDNNNNPVNIGFNFLIQSGDNQASTYMPTLSSTSTVKTEVLNNWTGSFTPSSLAILNMVQAFTVKYASDNGLQPQAVNLSDPTILSALGTQVQAWSKESDITDEASLTSALLTYSGMATQQDLEASYPTSLTPWDDLYIILQESFASSSNITLSTTLAQQILQAFVVVQGKALGVAPTAVDMTNSSNITAFTTFVNNLSHTNQTTLTNELTSDAGATSGTVTFTYNNTQYSMNFPCVDQNGLPLSESTLETDAGDALQSIFTQNASTVSSLQNVQGIPGRFLTTSESSDTAAQTQQAQSDMESRNEQNAILQQYVQTIRARQDAAQNITQNMQNAAQATKDDINEQTSVWDTILQGINDVIKSIFNMT